MNDLVQYLRIRINGMVRSERGASAVEYGLLVALIAIAIIVAVTLLGGNLSNIFNKTANSIS
jgi:pilus assembly protein Flp/PilA